MHAKSVLIGAGVVAGLAAAPAFAQEVRQLGPHVHGESHLTIAVEGKSLAMELHAPGNDIVGFEFQPSTDAQRAAVAAATATLRNPIGLFGIPAAAGCTLGKADVTLADEDEEDAPAPGAAAPPATPAAPAAKHTEFQVAYQLTCANVAAISALNFTFFAKFPNAMAVHVQLISGRGAFEIDVPRARPQVSTGNMF